jgi:2-dehydropantoate 2-reductase
MQVVVYGAGAVGSVLGGMLSLHNHDVRFVCRKPHADAIKEDGLHIRSATGDYVAHPGVSTSLSSGDVGEGVCVFVTVKSQHTAECVAALSRIVPAETPVVSFQNGIGNEDVLAGHFESVYAGVCRMTCQMVQPGHASFRSLGRLVVGRYPKGSDAFTRTLSGAFDEAGFDACVSRNVTADRWLKLAVNTQSVFHAVIDPRDHVANEFNELKARILEETKTVLKSAKLRPRSCDGNDDSIDEMIADLRRPRMPRVEHGMKVHNSSWQDLYLKRDSIESPLFHEPVIAMALEHGIPVPINEVALETIRRCHADADGPGTVRLQKVLDDIEARGRD